MDHKNKFAAQTVLQLQQSLDKVAPYQATELSKQQTIRTLSPQIFALRSKGYSWTAVAAMLSEHGVPVSVAALRTHLRRVREEGASAAPGNATKRVRAGRTVASPAEQPPPIALSPSPSGETPPARRPLQPGGAAASGVAALHATASGTRREPEPRRPPGEVKPDTGDI
jgi:hypothetical protein